MKLDEELFDEVLSKNEFSSYTLILLNLLLTLEIISSSIYLLIFTGIQTKTLDLK